MANSGDRKAFRELSGKNSNDYFDESQEYQMDNGIAKKKVHTNKKKSEIMTKENGQQNKMGITFGDSYGFQEE